MTTLSFSDWLKDELGKRGWSQSDLAKRAKISPSLITRLFSGERGVSGNTLQSIAAALKIPPEIVFHEAGLLPSKSDKSVAAQKIEYIVNDLSEEDQLDILEYARMRRRIAEERGRYESKRTPRDPKKP